MYPEARKVSYAPLDLYKTNTKYHSYIGKYFKPSPTCDGDTNTNESSVGASAYCVHFSEQLPQLAAAKRFAGMNLLEAPLGTSCYQLQWPPGRCGGHHQQQHQPCQQQ